MLRATARMRWSLVSPLNAAGNPAISVWFTSTRSVPPSSFAGIGRSSEPCASRRSSSIRNVSRAAQPSSGWWRLRSSSVSTTRGMTTSCSAKRPSARGSESRTDVSST